MPYTVPHTWTAGDFLRASWLNLYTTNQVDHEARIVALETSSGPGDVSGPASSVDGEVALFDSTTGKLLKRASVTGLLKAASGVLAQAVAGTDYSVPAGTETLTNKTLTSPVLTTPVLEIGGPTLTATRTTLTDAQIKALPTTPIQLAAAPGANRGLIPLMVVLNMDASAGAYTNVDGDGYLFVESGGGNLMSDYIANVSTMTPSALTYLTDFLSATRYVAGLQLWKDARETDNWGTLASLFPRTNMVNQTLRLSVNNAAAGAFTGGNAANTLVVDVIHLNLGI